MNTYNKKKSPIRIAEPLRINTIDKEKIKADNYPVFCFKYFKQQCQSKNYSTTSSENNPSFA